MTLSFDERLSRVGFRLAGWSSPKNDEAGAPDIEVTLLEIVEQLPEDGRLFSLALSWIQVHGAYVIVEKLRKLSRRKAEPSTLWLSALAAYAVRCRMPKWRALLRKLPEPRYFYPPEISDGAIAMKGAVPWLESLNFRVPEVLSASGSPMFCRLNSWPPFTVNTVTAIFTVPRGGLIS